MATNDSAGMLFWISPPQAEALKIVRRAKDGDHDAIGQLYMTTAPSIYRYLLNRGVSPDITEDLVQESFLRVIESLDRYDEQRHPFVAWLYGIARNALHEYMRKKEKDALSTPLPEYDETELIADDNVEETIERTERISWFSKAWQRLDPKERDLLISQRTRGPISRARSSALSKLRNFYEEEEMHPEDCKASKPEEGQPSERELVRQYLPLVKKTYREHLRLHIVEGWSYNAISDHLNEPVGTVKAYVKRGREAVKDLIAQGEAINDVGEQSTGESVDGDYTKIAPYLERLKEIYQRPIQLRCQDKLSFSQIAEILDLPVSTVKSQVKRGLILINQLRALDIGIPDSDEQKNGLSQIDS